MVYILVAIFFFVSGGMIGAAYGQWIADKLAVKNNPNELRNITEYLRQQYDHVLQMPSSPTGNEFQAQKFANRSENENLRRVLEETPRKTETEV